MIPELGKELFEGYIGESFAVAPENGPSVPLKLVKVMDTTAPAQNGKVYTESFSLFFEGTPETPLGQGLHTFRHERMGETALFMVPVVSRNPAARRYEVVFNRLVNS